MDRRVTSLGIAIGLMAESRKSLREHTWLLLGMTAVAIFVISPQQALHSWDGEHVTITSHDPFSYQVHQVLKSFLNAFGKEHPHERHLRENPRKNPDHPKHHSKLEKFVESHWKTWILSTLISVNLLFLVSTLLKYYASNYALTYMSLLGIMWFVLMDGVIQFLSLLMIVYLIIIDGCFVDWIALLFTGSFLISDFIGFWELHEMRRITVYVSYISSSFLSTFNKKDEDEKKMHEEVKSNPHAILDSVLRFFNEVKSDFDRRKWSMHAKYE